MVNPNRVPDISRSLELEAVRFHRILFGADPTPAVVEAYNRAHRFYLVDQTDALLAARVLERNLDIEALELVLRRDHPLLTRKLRLLIYIAETDPSRYPDFINAADQPVRAWISLIFAAVRTAGARLKGRAILLRNPDLLGRSLPPA